MNNAHKVYQCPNCETVFDPITVMHNCMNLDTGQCYQHYASNLQGELTTSNFQTTNPKGTFEVWTTTAAPDYKDYEYMGLSDYSTKEEVNAYKAVEEMAKIEQSQLSIQDQLEKMTLQPLTTKDSEIDIINLEIIKQPVDAEIVSNFPDTPVLKTQLHDPEEVIIKFEKIPMKPPWNPACTKCAENREHCGYCPNPKCGNCKELGEYCGYCNWVSYKDNEAYCKELIKHWGIDDEYEVVVADDYHLQIDCDTLEDVQYCLKQMKILKHKVEIKSYKITKSKSGNRHVIIELAEPYKIWQRVAMQACLGSDRVREILNILNILNQNNNPVLLIEKIEKDDDELKLE